MLILKSTVGVFYDIRVHIAENDDDHTGKKESTVMMGIRKVELKDQNAFSPFQM